MKIKCFKLILKYFCSSILNGEKENKKIEGE